MEDLSAPGEDIGTEFCSQTLNHDEQSKARRRAAGCVSPSPCGNGKLVTPGSGEKTCDEYPYASVVEGGSGAILLCTSDTENSAEGSDLEAFFNSVCTLEPCTFDVTFGNPGEGSTRDLLLTVFSFSLINGLVVSIVLMEVVQMIIQFYIIKRCIVIRKTMI